jgi:CRISPR system Cascade subunit CasD
MIDRIGPVRATPAQSTVAGLLANALGMCRWESDRLERLQARLVMGCRLDRRGRRFTEFQTAQLGKRDTGWTTWGRAEGREGGERTYDSPHIRYRDHDADARVTIALRLLGEDESPTLDNIARAIDEPARPLFLGRKACLPAVRLLMGFAEGRTVYDVLLGAPVDDAVHDGLAASGRATLRGARIDERVLFVLPGDEPCPAGFQPIRATERRDWPAGVHAGEIISFHGEVPRERLGSAASAS